MTGNNSKNCGLYILSTDEGSGPPEGVVTAGQGDGGAVAGCRMNRRPSSLDACSVRLFVHAFNDASHTEGVRSNDAEKERGEESVRASENKV